MNALLAASRQFARQQVGVGLEAYSQSSSLPVAGIAIATDVLSRIVLARARRVR
jgi:hypothetical protein